MTRKDFVLIANTVGDAARRLDMSEDDRRTMARIFADRLAVANGNFQRAIFVAACMED